MINSNSLSADSYATDSVALHFDEAMRLAGDFWTLRIVDAIASCGLRFCEIERALPTSNPATLVSRLKRLETKGLVVRIQDAQAKQSVSYELTDKGLALLPVIDSIKAFTAILDD